MNLYVLWLTPIKADPEPIFEAEQANNEERPRDVNVARMPEIIPQDRNASHPKSSVNEESHSTQESRLQNRSDILMATSPLGSHGRRIEARTAFRISLALMY
jgi:hypothetical protein